jgi:hypothetical protein
MQFSSTRLRRGGRKRPNHLHDLSSVSFGEIPQFRNFQTICHSSSSDDAKSDNSNAVKSKFSKNFYYSSTILKRVEEPLLCGYFCKKDLLRVGVALEYQVV